MTSCLPSRAFAGMSPVEVHHDGKMWSSQSKHGSSHIQTRAEITGTRSTRPIKKQHSIDQGGEKIEGELYSIRRQLRGTKFTD